MMKDGFNVMDSDMHVIEPSDLFEQYMDHTMQSQAPKIYRVEGQRFALIEWQDHTLPSCDAVNEHRRLGMTARVDRATTAMRYLGYNARSQLDAMDLEGIDVAVLFPTIGLYVPNGLNGVDGLLATAVCVAYNNWLYDFCQTDPSRLKHCALLPQHDIGMASKEARRAVQELGAIAVCIRPNLINGIPFHNPYYQTMWQTLQELNIPVCFHEGTGSANAQDGSEFGNNRLMAHACSHPMGQMKAMLSMVCGGVFETFPYLKAGYLEANTGWLPFWLSRMDRDFTLYRQWDAPTLKHKPSDYFLQNCWVGTESDEIELKYTLDAVGDSNIVFSSDYPHHDSEFPHAVEQFLENTNIPDKSKAKILWNNCARFYNLTEPEGTGS